MTLSSQGHRVESRLSFNNPQHKVRPSDNRLCRRASQHSTLTSYQQLRKVNHTEERRRASQDNRVERWDELRLRHVRP